MYLMSKRPAFIPEPITSLISDEAKLKFMLPKDVPTQELLEQLMTDFQDIKDQYGQMAAYAMFPESSLIDGVSHLTTPEGVNFTLETRSIHISEGALDEGPSSYKVLLTIPVAELKKQLLLSALYVKTRLHEESGSYVMETSTEIPVEEFEKIFAITLEEALIEKYLAYLNEAFEILLGAQFDTHMLLKLFTPKILSEDLYVLEDNEDYSVIVIAKNKSQDSWSVNRFATPRNRPQEIDVWLNGLKKEGNHPAILDGYEEVIITLMPTDPATTEEISSILF